MRDPRVGIWVLRGDGGIENVDGIIEVGEPTSMGVELKVRLSSSVISTSQLSSSTSWRMKTPEGA